MYLNKGDINTIAAANSGSNFSNSYYWSSTESNGYYALRQGFGAGGQDGNFKGFSSLVRAVRAF